MLRKKFNDDWLFMRGTENPLTDGVMNTSQASQVVHLPHDAMSYEKRYKELESGSQSGFYPGGSYTYIKKFKVPNEWKSQTTFFEFEGVYSNAKVFINGLYAGGCNNGYRNFYIQADMFFKYGEVNELKVTVNNLAQPNSRWYSGSGMYRGVNVLQGSLLHIGVDGVVITTPDINESSATIVVESTLVNESHLPKTVEMVTEILDSKQKVVANDKILITIFKEESTAIQRIYLKSPKLWNTENPSLYTCRIRLILEDTTLDEEIITFGIRKLKLDAEKGLQLNGETIKLRGTCLHHDNGLIGAATLDVAEERRCRLLKEAGFNCIRSAHQPISKAMLNACDKLGMLVIDEISDVWNVCKNHNDYATFFEENWEKDVVQMVMKDINHPSVIMYCLGNELPEAGTSKGAEINRKINKVIKNMDKNRYTTNAINGLTAASGYLPTIFAEFEQENTEEENLSQNNNDTVSSGSNDVNNMMAMLVGPLADAVATHPVMSQTIAEFVSGTDVAGFNYMTARHELEHQLHPNRIVLGTETFPSEIARLWEIVEKNPHVIGDMTWTGFDYLGEAGIGNFYYDGNRPFSNHWPDILAFCGDLDITGARRVISYYREIIFGLRKIPYITVSRLNRQEEKCLKTPWAFKDAIESWTWEGYEGENAKVEVYSDAEEVELFLNDVSIDRRKVGEIEPYIATFNVPYQPGTLKAVNYRSGSAAEKHTLKTADKKVTLLVKTDKDKLVADGEDLVFLDIYLVDKLGNKNLQQEREVAISINGPGKIEGFGSGIPQTENSYKNNSWITYDGHLLAAIRSTMGCGEIEIVVQTENDKKTVVLESHQKGLGYGI